MFEKDFESETALYDDLSDALILLGHSFRALTDARGRVHRVVADDSVFDKHLSPYEQYMEGSEGAFD